MGNVNHRATLWEKVGASAQHPPTSSANEKGEEADEFLKVVAFAILLEIGSIRGKETTTTKDKMDWMVLIYIHGIASGQSCSCCHSRNCTK